MLCDFINKLLAANQALLAGETIDNRFNPWQTAFATSTYRT
jgi:hypothetical protein